MQIIRTDAVQRVSFGRIVSPHIASHEGHAPVPVLGLGKRPKAAKGGLSLVRSAEPMQDPIYSQLSDAVPALRKHALTGEESPYADKDGLVKGFADELFSGLTAGDPMGLIGRIIENRPYLGSQAEMMFPHTPTIDPPFRFDPAFLTPDALISAGGILSQAAGRIVADGSTGGAFFTLTHPMEPYLLSVAALRARGVGAYPASAVLPGERGEIYHPLIAIVDLTEEVPLMTFDLLAVHPPMGSVDILSDTAVKAVTFTMLAQARVMLLCTEMFMQSRQGRELSLEELMHHLGRVAEPLFEAHRRWPGCHFINNSLAMAFEDFTSVLTDIQIAESEGNMEALLAQTPAFALPGVLQQHIQSSAMESATSFVEHIKHEMALLIAKQPPDGGA